VSLTHLLDTGWIVRHFRGTKSYTGTIVAIGASRVAFSMLSVAELYEGVFRVANPAAAEQALLHFLSDKTILPITHEICRLFGERRAALRRTNHLIGDMDLLIGVTCLHRDLTLLTPNPRHFERLAGLHVVSVPST
jgi:tRNA(fMet)-specific endonuclease VapC